MAPGDQPCRGLSEWTRSLSRNGEDRVGPDPRPVTLLVGKAEGREIKLEILFSRTSPRCRRVVPVVLLINLLRPEVLHRGRTVVGSLGPGPGPTTPKNGRVGTEGPEGGTGGSKILFGRPEVVTPLRDPFLSGSSKTEDTPISGGRLNRVQCRNL